MRGTPPMMPLPTKKTPKIRSRCGGKFVRRQVSHTRERTRYFRHVGGLITLAAKALWCQERSVRLNQNVRQRQSLRNVAQMLRFRIGRIARKRNHEAHVEHTLRVFERAGEAVQDAAKSGTAPMLVEHVQRVGPCVAAVDDDREFRLRR